jgi:hypothetical protein
MGKGLSLFDVLLLGQVPLRRNKLSMSKMNISSFWRFSAVIFWRYKQILEAYSLSMIFAPA